MQQFLTKIMELSVHRHHRRFALTAMAIASSFALALAPAPAAAQWSTTYEQFYLPGKFNWQFRDKYPAADRLFNGFDFGHAILYETLWTNFDGSVTELEEKWYNRLTRDILLNPPKVPLEESAIEIAYAKLAPEAKQMFDWTHLLHRQIYDVWADERLLPGAKDEKVAELIRYYRSRPDLAFSSKPKSMVLMQEQPYSLAFRKGYPKFNGLIWAYHWLQIGLYEPLVVGRNVDERQAGVRATLARFWQMLQEPTRTLPHLMPMTAAVAPEFSKRYPEAAIIFDNLHSMHDVVSDILANPAVPNNRKRAEVLLAALRYRDDTSFVMSEQAWRTMADHMGIENMGGPVLSALTPLPTPTVTYGAVMTHDERTGEMTGFKYGQATGGEHAGHAMPADTGRAAVPRDSAGRAARPQDHAQHQMPTRSDTARGGQMQPDSGRASQPSMSDEQMTHMLSFYMHFMADSVIRSRVMGDSTMRRMMADVMQSMAGMLRNMPPEHLEHMQRMMRDSTTTPAPAARSASKPAAKPAPKPAPRKPATKPTDPHAGHQPPAKPAPKKPPFEE